MMKGPGFTLPVLTKIKDDVVILFSNAEVLRHFNFGSQFKNFE